MNRYAVLTGDISNFTRLSEKKRIELINETEALIKSWVKKPNLAEVFRGDSYQLMLDDITDAVQKSIRLICWYKKYDTESTIDVGTRISIGIGSIGYKGKSVLDSDGEAFHLSGRTFDKMTAPDLLRITTADEAINRQIAIILIFANRLISQWTKSQAEVVYLATEGHTQSHMASLLGIHQGAVNNRLKLANWKILEEGINYIVELLTGMVLNN